MNICVNNGISRVFDHLLRIQVQGSSGKFKIVRLEDAERNKQEAGAGCEVVTCFMTLDVTNKYSAKYVGR
jgi:hypothetical protein